jgi:cell division protein FtsI/penicillin-binding protein 2
MKTKVSKFSFIPTALCYLSSFITLTIFFIILVNNSSHAENRAQIKTNSSQKIIKKYPIKTPIVASQEVKPIDDSMLSSATLKQTTIPNPFQINQSGEIFLSKVPNFNLSSSANMIGLGTNGNTINYTFDPDLQKYVYNLVRQASAPHVAVVAMDLRTGKILAISDKSATLKNAALHAGFPAASLFKIITTAAALENTKLQPKSPIKFRGGTYELSKNNYNPNTKYDRRVMALDEALGHSCNAVFARVALQHLSANHLKTYANHFGFNTNLQFDSALTTSNAYIPSSSYELARTAAGFGQVYISPVHAASLMSSVANGGILLRPHMVDKAKSKHGSVIYEARTKGLKRSVNTSTAKTLMHMLEKSVTSGTSRYAFYSRGRPTLPGIRAVGKTGTLKGKNPSGLNRWFIGAAPLENPQVVVAAITLNPRNTMARPSYLAKQIFDQYLRKQKKATTYRKIS